MLLEHIQQHSVRDSRLRRIDLLPTVLSNLLYVLVLAAESRAGTFSGLGRRSFKL